MLLISVPFIIFCGIWTVSSSGTASLALSANAQVSWFLQTPPRQFYRDPTTFIHLSGLDGIKTNYRDPMLVTTYRDLQKPRHRDADGT
jgi:hypothetical protein